MKVTNHMNNSIVIAGKEIKAGETKQIKDKDWDQASEGRVIKALLEKRCLSVEPSFKKKEIKQDPVTEELKSFYDL